MEIAALADLLHEMAEWPRPVQKSDAPHTWWDRYAAYTRHRGPRGDGGDFRNLSCRPRPTIDHLPANRSS